MYGVFFLLLCVHFVSCFCSVVFVVFFSGTYFLCGGAFVFFFLVFFCVGVFWLFGLVVFLFLICFFFVCCF